MRVGIDGRSLVRPEERGVARYAGTLLGELAQAFPDDEWRVLVPRGAQVLSLPGTDVVQVPLPSRILYGAAGVVGRPRLDALLQGVDVFWAPAPAPLAIGTNTPLVLTLHDLAWEVRPEDFTAYERLWHRLARPQALAARAARVVAVSEATHTEVIARWGLDPERVVTIREGVPAPDQPIAPSRQPSPYLLSVGALEPRKAPDTLLSAYQRARQRGLDAELILVGTGRLANDLAGSGVRLLGRVSDDELQRLYAGAVGLVMPSRYEGFGLPPLEAAVHGTPSILTDLPAFRETLGEAALFVAVDDADALATAMVKLASDVDLQRALGSEARHRLAALRPDAAARALHQVLAAAAVMFRRT